jgi:hypothetical protein
MAVATSSRAVKSGMAPRSGVGDGDGLGVGVGDAVGDDEGVGDGVGTGVGVGSGGRTHAARSRATTMTGTARTGLPTNPRVDVQRSRRGTSEASRSAISRAFVVP